jgi:hypothetical protein
MKYFSTFSTIHFIYVWADVDIQLQISTVFNKNLRSSFYLIYSRFLSILYATASFFYFSTLAL